MKNLIKYLKNHMNNLSIEKILKKIKPNSCVLDLSRSGIYYIDPSLYPLDSLVDVFLSDNNQEELKNQVNLREKYIGNIENLFSAEVFKKNKYDLIIAPYGLISNAENLLDECKALLAPQGELILAVPNASYWGRIFGILPSDTVDKLAFTTPHSRKSLIRFINAQGWKIHSLQKAENLLQNTVTPHHTLEQLPPAVAHYVKSQPDALVSDFIISITPENHQSGNQNTEILLHSCENQGLEFSSTLYWGNDAEDCLAHSAITHGIIGKTHQRIFFQIPSLSSESTILRWFPADRCGFMHLHELTLKSSNGQVLWTWSSPRHLDDAKSHHIHIQDFLCTAPGSNLMLLSQEDAWLEIPIPLDILSKNISRSNLILEMQIGWPISADYLQMSSHLENIKSEKESIEKKYLTQKKYLSEHKSAIVELSESNAEFRKIRTNNDEMIKNLNHTISEQKYHIQELDKNIHQIQNSGSYKLARKLSAVKDKIIKKSDRLENSLILVSQTQDIESNQQSEERTKYEIGFHPEKLEININSSNHESKKIEIFSPRGTDIIIPVYRGIDETMSCVNSVLSSLSDSTEYSIIIINDKSPEPAITSWLRDISLKNKNITLIENNENLGFVASVNLGMQQNPEHDVLLLNSDTLVANNWLEKIKAHAYSSPKISSVTPLSNNATICSYPVFCQSNLLPAFLTTADVDSICAQVNHQSSVPIPTAVGFCMFIRRDSLNEVGYFDEEHFGKGYGEENDFCMRAHNQGWKHLLALDTFVYHSGGVSFGASKSPREQAAYDVLTDLHPQYEALVQQHVAQDPAKFARNNIDRHRLKNSKKSCVLMVTHSIGGGTQRHVVELVAHFEESVNILQLCPLPNNFIRLKWLNAGQAYEEDFYWPSEASKLKQLLKDFGVVHVHFHHLLGINPAIMELPQDLGVAYDFTSHDYYTCCPQIFLTLQNNTYCGEQGIKQCQSCVQARPTPTGEDIQDWRLRHRLFVEGARYVLAPSLDIASRMRKYFPNAPVRFVPHLDIGDIQALPQPKGQPISAHANLRIFILGGVNAPKGAFLMEAVARLAAQYDAPLELHLIGYPHLPLQCQPHASLTIHGGYTEPELPILLQRLKPDLIWFPALWPETYSYTLSAALQQGLPVVAPDLGAFSERLHERPWTWLQPWDTDADAWVTFFTQIRQQHFIDNTTPPIALSHNPCVSSATFPAWNYDDDYLNIAHPQH